MITEVRGVFARLESGLSLASRFSVAVAVGEAVYDVLKFLFVRAENSFPFDSSTCPRVLEGLNFVPWFTTPLESTGPVA
jgi:hypothetical protein